MKKFLLLLVALLACLTADAYSVFTYCVPNGAAEVQIGTDLLMSSYNFVDAEPGETVYFTFEPFMGYQLSGMRFKNITADDVAELDGNIYSFTMPQSNVSIFLDFEYVTETYSDVTIDETTFPDPNFRNWLLSQSYGSDGVITGDEVANVTNISANACGIEDLTGIEHFPALTNLDVSNFEDDAEDTWNRIITLDLSGNPLLRNIYCDNNILTSINVSECSDLKILFCGDNQLTSLNLAGNPRLSILSCIRNQLTELDLSDNTNLDQLYCEYNQLTSINVANLSKMIILNCNDNHLTSLDVSGCTAMFQLYFYNNQIKGQAMEDFVTTLPTPPNGGYMVVIDLDNEMPQNEMTAEQVATARAKTWSVEAITGDDFVQYDGTETTVVPGDVNNDGSVTSADVTALYNYLLNDDETYINSSDVDGDGAITSGDITFIYNIILGN